MLLSRISSRSSSLLFVRDAEHKLWSIGISMLNIACAYGYSSVQKCDEGILLAIEVPVFLESREEMKLFGACSHASRHSNTFEFAPPGLVQVCGHWVMRSTQQNHIITL